MPAGLLLLAAGLGTGIAATVYGIFTTPSRHESPTDDALQQQPEEQDVDDDEEEEQQAARQRRTWMLRVLSAASASLLVSGALVHARSMTQSRGKRLAPAKPARVAARREAGEDDGVLAIPLRVMIRHTEKKWFVEDWKVRTCLLRAGADADSAGCRVPAQPHSHQRACASSFDATSVCHATKCRLSHVVPHAQAMHNLLAFTLLQDAREGDTNAMVRVAKMLMHGQGCKQVCATHVSERR